MFSNRNCGMWVDSSSVAFVIFSILPVVSGICLVGAGVENNQPTTAFSTLIEQIKTTPKHEVIETLCENALSSGLLSRGEVGMVYGMKAANYFTIAMELHQGMKGPANRNRDTEKQIEFLLRGSLQHYNTAIAIIPGLYRNYWHRGYIYELMAELDKAVADYTKALELNPNFVKAYIYRARVLMEQGRRQQATEDIDRALTLGPGTVTIDALNHEQALQQIVEVLWVIVECNPETPLAEKVDDAAAKTQTALDELAKTPPDNQAAVGNIDGAVGELEAAVEDGLLDTEQGKQLMDDLAVIAKHLAVDAINKAIDADGDPDR